MKDTAMKINSADKSLYDHKHGWTWHWIALVVGALLIGFGVFMIVTPEATVATLALVVGIAIIIRALMVIAGGFRSQGAQKPKQANIAFILGGLLLIVGIVFVVQPEFSHELVVYGAAILFILDALSNFVLIPRLIRHNVWVGIAGIVANVVAIGAAVAVLFQPDWSWFTVPLGLGVSVFGLGLAYVLFGVASRGWLRNPPDRRSRSARPNRSSGTRTGPSA